jgi:hypothetical protein
MDKFRCDGRVVKLSEGEYVKLDDLLEYLTGLLNDYGNPMTYQESEYYDKCKAKVDILEDIIGELS